MAGPISKLTTNDRIILAHLRMNPTTPAFDSLYRKLSGQKAKLMALGIKAAARREEKA